jgi:hypothetical protein
MVAKTIVVLLMVATTLPALPQPPQQARYTLSIKQVAAVVVRSFLETGITLTDQQISLPARVVATERIPTLDISSVEVLSEYVFEGHSKARSKIRLTCRIASVCLPFYAIVIWPEGLSNPSGAPSFLSAHPARVPKPMPEITMQAGTHATLVLDDERAHIQLTVVSLESGSTGHKIRVASPDHKQIYIAEIIGANLLKGSF